MQPLGKKLALVLAASIVSGGAWAQTVCVNDAPNPYRLVGSFGQLPEGRKWAATNAVYGSSDGHIWVVDRCGGPDNCAGNAIAPIFELDQNGKVLKNFGAGLFVFPHSIFKDQDGFLWVADLRTKDGKGQQIFKLDQTGKIVMSLGKPGQSGTGLDVFDGPDAAVVAQNGDIIVAEGHTPGFGNSRMMKFSKDGAFLKTWSGKGSEPGQLLGPHGVALDSRGRVFVADRENNRIEIFDAEGKYLDTWRQFGRPSGIFIDKNDTLYVADSQSNEKQGDAAYNPGCKMGIRVGNAKDGKVTAYIPPPPDGITPPEGVTVDNSGNVYGARVDAKDMIKYTK